MHTTKLRYDSHDFIAIVYSTQDTTPDKVIEYIQRKQSTNPKAKVFAYPGNLVHVRFEKDRITLFNIEATVSELYDCYITFKETFTEIVPIKIGYLGYMIESIKNEELKVLREAREL